MDNFRTAVEKTQKEGSKRLVTVGPNFCRPNVI